MGPVRLDIAFAMPQPDLSTAVATATDIPLVVPSDGRDYSNVAIVTADRGIRVEQREGPWSIVEASKNPTAAPLSIHLTSGDPAAELRLALAIDDRRPEQATFVDRQWIQTWLTKSVRQDRAVFHITSDAESLHIKLPAGIQPRDVELAVDGTAISPEGDSAGGLLVKLGAGSPRREHLVAMRYQFDGQGARTGWQPFDLPSFEKPVKVRETYWQLVLPSDEALLGADGNLAPEYIWRWRDYGLGIERVPLKEQPQLEQWVGMTVASRGGNSAAANERPLVDDDLPSQTSRYLFSTAGPEGRFAILVIPRWMLLFGASLGALVVGLSLIYVPAVRRPHVLIAAAALLLIAVLVWPEAALLLAQAASLGVGLVLLASALRRMMTWSDSREMTSSGRAPAIAERSSQRARFRSLDDEKAATTTASIAVEVSASGSGESAVGADGADTGDEERQAAEPAVGASGSSRAHRLT
jgi:hypothetical protein